MVPAFAGPLSPVIPSGFLPDRIGFRLPYSSGGCSGLGIDPGTGFLIKLFRAL